MKISIDTLAALAWLAVSASVACKAPQAPQGGTRLLGIDFEESDAGRPTTTAQAYETVRSNGYFAGGGLGLAEPAELSPEQMSKLLDETVKIAFGHADGQKAYVTGKVIPCADAPGKVARTFAAGHLCYVPKDSGLGNLALLPCGSLEKPDESCFDVTDFLSLYRSTFLKPKDGGLAAREGESVVDTRFDRLQNTRITERHGRMTLSGEGVGGTGSVEVLQFENVAEYASKLPAARFQSFKQKGRGLLGFQYYENAGDPRGGPIALTNTGEPFPNGREPGAGPNDAANPFDVLQASFAVVPSP